MEQGKKCGVVIPGQNDRDSRSKLEELRLKYEKLLKNVRSEEREKHQVDTKRMEDRNIQLTLDNESLKKQLHQVHSLLYSSRNKAIEGA